MGSDVTDDDLNVYAPGTGGFVAPDILGAPGTFTLTEIDPPPGQTADTVGAYCTGAVIPVAGYGGWSRVARPRRKALTEWVGRDSMSLEIPFMFDAFITDMIGPGVFVESQIRTLERFAGIDEDDPEPPLMTIESVPAKLIPHNKAHAGHVRWFVDTLQWDRDTIIALRSGNRVRAGGTLTITQYVKDERMEKTSSVQRRKKKASKTGVKGGRKKTYTVKSGDTLSKIAARDDVYGDANKWHRIADANHIRDPRNIKVGRELKIP